MPCVFIHWLPRDPIWILAVRSWRACQAGRYLDASDGNRLDALLWWLRGAGLRSTQIVVRVTDASSAAITRLNDQIVSVFKSTPTIERLRRRADAGRPALHLAIAERLPPEGRTHGEAALSMTGFRALMLTSFVVGGRWARELDNRSAWFKFRW